MDNTDDDDPLDALTAAYQAEAQAQNDALLTRLKRAGHKKDQVSLRQQGLSTSLIPRQQQDVQPSKGVALLKKMGYQEGKGLGSQLQGRSEPIPLVIRSKRSGLGIHEAKEQQLQAAEEREVQERAKRQRLDQATAGSFTQRVKSEFQSRKLLRQLREAWQAAESLEEQQAGKQPRVREDDDDVGVGLCGDVQGSSSSSAVPNEGSTVSDTVFSTPFKRLNMLLTRNLQLQQLLAHVCPSPNHQADMQQENIKAQHTLAGNSLQQRTDVAQLDISKLDPTIVESELQALLTFLRDSHRYCLFCGCAFDSQNELQENCPGLFEADHE